MPSTDLSVSELARMTGLPIDPSWSCATVAAGLRHVSIWCSPEMHADTLLGSDPSTLPAGCAVRVERRTGAVAWDADWPLALDVQWLREVTPGFPLGVRPVRVHLATPLKANVQLHGEFVTLVWRAAAGGTRVQVVVDPGGAPPAVALKARSSHPAPPAVMDELLRALTGSTSVEWLRGLFAESCSSRWRELAVRIGARPDRIDDLAVYFRTLTTTQEDALWRAASSSGGLSRLQPWVESLQPGQLVSFVELLEAELRVVGPAFWHSSAGSWINAIAGNSLSGWRTPGVVARLAEAARKLLSLSVRDDLASLLVRLRATADAEWTGFAPWYRARIKESCGALSLDAGSGEAIHALSPWMKRLHARLQQESLEAALRRAKEALARATLTTRCLEPKSDFSGLVLADLGVASAEKSDPVVHRILGGDLRPCMDASSNVEMHGGLLNNLQGRRIGVEVLMPSLDKRSWAAERESLATALIVPSGGGQLTVSCGDVAEEWGAARQGAGRLLGAVFTSRAEAPADDMIHSVVESRRALLGNESDFAWLRLVRAYGLPVPEQTALPCEATMRIQIPASWAEDWRLAPFKRDASYFDKVMRFSLAMQEMARYWVPALSLTEAHQFDSPNAVWPVLVFAATRPYADRRKAEFGYDAMSPFRVERATESAVTELPGLLEPLYRRLKASGRTDTAELYSPNRARLIVSAVQRRPRRLAVLLAGDAFHLEQCLHLAMLCREMRVAAKHNPTQALRKLTKWSAQIAKAHQRGASLGGMVKNPLAPSCDNLASVYLLEATRALADGSRADLFRASLTMETKTGVQRFEAAA